MASSTLENLNETPVKPVDLAKVADDAVDFVTRGIDQRGRFTLPPNAAVSVVTLVRGLAMAAETGEQLRLAIEDPAWARGELARIVTDLADASSRRTRADHEAEAEVLATIVRPPNGQA